MSLRNPLWLISRLILSGALFVGYSVIANLAHPLHMLGWTTLIAADANQIFPILIGVGMVSVVGIWLGKQAQEKADDPGPVDTSAAEAGSLPSDLPPGSAGMLVAGELRPAHISAQLIDLARRGALTLTQIDDEDTVVTKVAEFRGETSRIDNLLLETVGKSERQVLRMVMARAGHDHERFARALRQPLSAQGLMRSHWSLFNFDPAFAFWLAWATIVLRGMARGLSGSPIRPDLGSPAAIVLYVVGGLCLLYGVFGQSGGESLTGAGERARKQWRAFYSWLMGSYADSESDAFERYLPYAVALGAQARWVEKHASAGNVAAPMWYRLRPMTTGTGASAAGGPARGSGPANISPPSLNEMSEGLYSSLGQASQGLFGMLNSGATAFQRSIPQARSGGGGGTGFGGPAPGRSSSGWGSSSMSRRPGKSTSSSGSLSRSRRGSSISSSRGSSSLGRSRRSSSTSLGGSRKSSSTSKSSSSKRSSGGSRSGGFRR